jgi:acyl carrier protein
MESTREKLHGLLLEVCGLPAGFPSDADLYLDLGVPSVKAMQLLMELEERFQVSVPDDQFVEATTFDRLVGMIEGLLGQ